MANQTRQSWTDVCERAVAFSKEWEKACSEKSQKHDFLRAFLRVFGTEG